MKRKSLFNNWVAVAMLCMTLGLAPYVPEPHIWGKLRWVLGGGVGMKVLDYFDLLMHGFPWVLLLRLSVVQLMRIKNKLS